jgi:hypothetical protein
LNVQTQDRVIQRSGDMQTETVVWVKCRFSRGGFPTERVFHITGPDGGDYTGIAPAKYCYAKDKKTLLPQPRRGETVEGFLRGISIGETDTGLLRVNLPNGENYEISEDQVRE